MYLAVVGRILAQIHSKVVFNYEEIDCDWTVLGFSKQILNQFSTHQAYIGDTRTSMRC